jgi:hypothetical protein
VQTVSVCHKIIGGSTENMTDINKVNLHLHVAGLHCLLSIYGKGPYFNIASHGLLRLVRK